LTSKLPKGSLALGINIIGFLPKGTLPKLKAYLYKDITSTPTPCQYECFF
jgi:hypothetical protein